MKKPIEILQVLGLVSITICCDCWYEKWDWSDCKSSKEHPLGLILNTPKITENCSYFILNGTAKNRLGKMTSSKVTADGRVNGMPVTYSEPYGCRPKVMGPEDDEVTYVLTVFNSLFCAQLDKEQVFMKVPFAESERDLLEAIAGPFQIQIKVTYINGLPSESDCFDLSGILHCEVDDDE